MPTREVQALLALMGASTAASQTLIGQAMGTRRTARRKKRSTRKKTTSRRRRRSTGRTKKKTKAQIRAERLKNLAKARRARKRKARARRR